MDGQDEQSGRLKAASADVVGTQTAGPAKIMVSATCH